jgi:hypothetical protein
MAKTAESKESPLYLRAKKAYTRVKPLVSRIEVVSDDERADMVAKVKEFEVALKRVESKGPRTGSPPGDEN